MALETNLNGRKAVVTGASQGIGQAIATALAEEGVDLYLAARSPGPLEKLSETLSAAHGVSVRTFALDMSRSADQRALAEAAADADILINNAGSIPKGRLEEIDEETWRAAWDLKVFGYINLCRLFYASMKKRGGGVILNNIGNAGDKPVADYIAGGTGNAALMAFTQALGGESPRDGIRVVGLSPGPVGTERLIGMMKSLAAEKWGDEARYPELFKPFAFERTATPQEMARIAVFLVSDLAAYVSGTTLTADGGLVRKGPFF